ncbi:putative TIR domain, P-loop containing nucleoside triphosphate hydrolase [Helianthus annuus]|uniref:ADP-ribosyl cyclase/cyclic ADP-ribose hydrolase n=1 Tax=Helianthus annuus TaxID=4232 RepID=A0A9K3J4B6_HELAN|nr:TMV resistance protein N [Helianthus annuus]KAF5808017.1 putative TIR domain, P-loop containing nucleoside triphosphate hydrolase [Helianthus annuus]KAJ0586457.1 putative TIR domain, P-loop containing nucleoside triphosphate hydrolase [Helianthus annuus]KAJ0595196.1 putative TIR domain, P-loop containing nucleoside triphosphate hydrolase [Helianthus annuus]
MDSSSSSFQNAPASYYQSCKYDVFLSFRGEDTRKTFVDHLYSTLKQHLIRVYKDNETLPRGESIDQALFEAIEESRIAVIIFSKNYANSSWCLEELAHIMKCKDERELIVIPIFYDVEPTEVRNCKRKFGEAFAKQEAKNVDKAEIWRKALVDVSNIAGWEPKNIADGHESQFIKKIVDTILDRLFVLNSCVDEDLVGMRARFQDLESLLDIGSGGVRMVGIWGVGGSGKTTLATSVYMELTQHFQGYCIVENIRVETSKYGLTKMQEKILSALFKKEVNVHSVVEGKHMMKSMLCRRKVLVLLDDVDEPGQLEALAGKHNWFGSGSRIIITTRDKHLLRTHKVDHVYPVTLLSDDEAIQLFRRHAYNEEDPVEDYETLSLRVVSYAARLPLAIKVLGSFLYDKNKKEWISTLDRLKDIPEMKIVEKLKISFDGLKTMEKQLFLDIACFFRGRWTIDEAMEIFEACEFHPEIGIKVLRQKSLITIYDSEFGARFDMHDLVQEMGHYIVRGEHPKNPEKHSRLWKREEIKEMCSGSATMENNQIEAILYEPLPVLPWKIRDHDYSLPLCKQVSNMKKLRWLSVSTMSEAEDEGPNFLSNELRYIKWYSYPARSPFLNGFLPMKLVVLKLTDSKQNELWKDDQHLPHLSVLQLVRMEKLSSTPNFDGLPRLKKLTLLSCKELEEIHPSLGNHSILEYLEVSHCYKLKRLPTISRMKNIKALLIMRCSLKDEDMPYGIGELSNLQELNLCCNSFSRLDFSLSQLTQLKSLNLSSCDKLLELPELPSSLALLKAHQCKSLILVKDFYKNCKQLSQVSLIDGWSDKLLQFMLKGKAIEDGSMRLQLEGVEIPKGLTPPLLRGNSCRLELPENWCSDFSGFLICVVTSYDSFAIPYRIWISMKHVSNLVSEDDVVWEERPGEKYMTWVWYVSFDLLRHTTWWDQTYKALSFENEFDTCKGFGVRLVEKSASGLTETPTDSSSRFTPKIKIQHDSTAALTIS